MSGFSNKEYLLGRPINDFVAWYTALRIVLCVKNSSCVRVNRPHVHDACLVEILYHSSTLIWQHIEKINMVWCFCMLK